VQHKYVTYVCTALLLYAQLHNPAKKKIAQRAVLRALTAQYELQKAVVTGFLITVSILVF
jgi:predicted lysophospholipase L1 biosynthesis ABC-type transport system permease subunit